MAAAYSTFANGGKQVQADPDRPHPGSLGPDDLAPRRSRMPGLQGGKWKGQAEPTLPADDRKQIIDPHTAYQITSMMEGVVQRGTATDRQADPSQCADRRQDRHDQRRKGRLVRRLSRPTSWSVSSSATTRRGRSARA